MYLKQHARREFACAQLFVNVDHGQLDQISGCALQRRVYGCALGEPAHVRVLAVDVRNGAYASEHGFYFLLTPGLFQYVINKLANALIFLKIGLDELLGFALLNAKLRGQSERRNTIDNAEVHGLGAAAMFGINHQLRYLEYL